MRKKTKRRIFLFVILLFSITAVFFLLPDYTRKALIYWYADTDDYLIFPNNIIKAVNPSEWLVENPDVLRKPDRSTYDSILRYDPLALLIVRNDTILYEEYFNGHTAQSVSNTFSVTKSLVSILTGIAIKEGKIGGLSDKVSCYLPIINGDYNGKPLTLRHLLEMSSGISYKERYSSPFGATTRSYYGSDIEDQMLSLRMKEEPGKKFDYIGANTQLLGMVLMKATGKSVSAYAEEKLWGPLQASADALWSKDRKDGMEKAFCCFNATARDLGRIGKLVCDSGIWNGDTIIEPSFYCEMIKPLHHIFYDNKTVDFYGLHWWLTKYHGMDVIYARGLKGQYIVSIPAQRIVIVRLGRQKSSEYQGEHPSDLYLYLRAAGQIAGF